MQVIWNIEHKKSNLNTLFFHFFQTGWRQWKLHVINLDRSSLTVWLMSLTPVQKNKQLHPGKNHQALSNVLSVMRFFVNQLLWSTTFKPTTGIMTLKANSSASIKIASSAAQTNRSIRPIWWLHMVSVSFPVATNPANCHFLKRVRWKAIGRAIYHSAVYAASLSLKMQKEWMITCWSICQIPLEVSIHYICTWEIQMCSCPLSFSSGCFPCLFWTVFRGWALWVHIHLFSCKSPVSGFLKVKKKSQIFANFLVILATTRVWGRGREAGD